MLRLPTTTTRAVDSPRSDAGLLQDIPGRDIVSMAGNGMQLAVVGTLVAYTMGTTAKLASPTEQSKSECSTYCGLDGGVSSDIDGCSWEDALASGRNRFLQALLRPIVYVCDSFRDDIDGDEGGAEHSQG